MIAEMDQVVSSMLGQPSLKEMSGAELKHLTLQYPYASFLHLLRSRKLKDAKDPEYPASVAITALYFNNPHWLHHQLQTTTQRSRVQEWEKAMDELEKPSAPPAQHVQSPSAPAAEPEPAAPEPVMADVVQLAEAHAGAYVETPTPEPVEVTHDSQPEPLAVASPVEPVIEQETEQTHAEVDMPGSSERLSEMLKTPADPHATLEVPIEPLYTVDYFASLGIRAPLEGGADALGTKLKSFTEWLKAMRRIHPEKIDLGMDAGSENRIRREADLSNDTTGIATETLAEVLVRQGLKEKAVEVYRKLSLLEPAKSAYFAAKINELKAS